MSFWGEDTIAALPYFVSAQSLFALPSGGWRSRGASQQASLARPSRASLARAFSLSLCAFAPRRLGVGAGGRVSGEGARVCEERRASLACDR